MAGINKGQTVVWDKLRTGPLLLLLFVVIAMGGGCGEPATQQSPAALGLRVSSLLGMDYDERFARAAEPRQFVFPADHGKHPYFASEWWYVTAVVQDAQGHDYGVQFTLFRQGLSPGPSGPGPWHTGDVYLGHLAVTDVGARVHHHAQRFSRGHPRLAGVSVQPELHAWIEDWSLNTSETNPSVMLLKASSLGEFEVALTLRQTRPIVLQGERGLSRKGPDSGSYYYSMPRLEVSGLLGLGERAVDVHGLAWLDREWSTSVLSSDLLGWDWFGLQLADGRNIMAFRLRKKNGERDPFDHGMLIDPLAGEQAADPQNKMASPVSLAAGDLAAGDKGVRILQPRDFRLLPQSYWQDERGVQWPVKWTMELGEERFTIEALLNDQVMDAALIYWEGIVEVRDHAGRRIGRGYMELTGYDTNGGTDSDG